MRKRFNFVFLAIMSAIVFLPFLAHAQAAKATADMKPLKVGVISAQSGPIAFMERACFEEWKLQSRILMRRERWEKDPAGSSWGISATNWKLQIMTTLATQPRAWQG